MKMKDKKRVLLGIAIVISIFIAIGIRILYEMEYLNSVSSLILTFLNGVILFAVYLKYKRT